MAEIQNYSLYSGDSKTLEITLYKDSTKNNVEDLTGAIIKYVIKKSKRDVSNLVYKDTTSGISVDIPTSGIFKVALNPSDTTNLSGKYYHEAEITDANGNVSTLLTGVVTVTEDGI